ALPHAGHAPGVEETGRRCAAAAAPDVDGSRRKGSDPKRDSTQCFLGDAASLAFFTARSPPFVPRQSHLTSCDRRRPYRRGTKAVVDLLLRDYLSVGSEADADRHLEHLFSDVATPIVRR